MPAQMTRDDVGRIVMDLVKAGCSDRGWITEATEFEDDLGEDSDERCLYRDEIRRRVRSQSDCGLASFEAEDCEQAVTIGDMIDSAWKALAHDCPAAVKK
jgi:hypothetical protein